jgi:hypothetical protein
MRLELLLGVVLLGCGTQRAPTPTPCPLDRLQPTGSRDCAPSGRVCEIQQTYFLNATPFCNGEITCENGQWRERVNGLACVGCPSTPDGGTCNTGTFGAMCSYPDAGLVCGCTACGATGWSCIPVGAPCNPRPRIGQPCADSVRCDYGGTVEGCFEGVWVADAGVCP